MSWQPKTKISSDCIITWFGSEFGEFVKTSKSSRRIYYAKLCYDCFVVERRMI